MSGEKTSVHDLMAVPSTRSPVGDRIARRIEVLRGWSRDGVPAGKSVPESLAAARRWEDPEIGIVAVPSPNDFTKTHHAYGKQVSEVADLLTALHRRYERPRGRRPARAAVPATKLDWDAIKRQFEKLASQWHTERDRGLDHVRRAEAAEKRLVWLSEESAEKDATIADLRRQVASRQGLRVVE